MDRIISAELHQDSAYLTTAGGDVWRVWFAHEPYPFQERLTDRQMWDLRAFQREAEGRAKARENDLSDQLKQHGLTLMVDPAGNYSVESVTC